MPMLDELGKKQIINQKKPYAPIHNFYRKFDFGLFLHYCLLKNYPIANRQKPLKILNDIIYNLDQIPEILLDQTEAI